MGKGKQRRFVETYGIDAPAMTALLEDRARVLLTLQGHDLTAWQSAKHKFGKGAKSCYCHLCGKRAFVLPRGSRRGTHPVEQDSPAIRGDAVFEGCVPRG